jgi:uncharacterized membrane protein YeaQ/YmgE (transglycosylase-associated protein family)
MQSPGYRINIKKGADMDWILWLVLGLVAGVLALIVVERTIPPEPMGWIGALLIGLIGGVLGGWIANLLRRAGVRHT